MIEIEDGIPLTNTYKIGITPRSEKAKTLCALEVGQSFFLVDPLDVDVRTMRSTASYWGLRLGRSFTLRTVEEQGRIGVRVWRLDDPT